MDPAQKTLVPLNFFYAPQDGAQSVGGTAGLGHRWETGLGGDGRSFGDSLRPRFGSQQEMADDPAIIAPADRPNCHGDLAKFPRIGHGKMGGRAAPCLGSTGLVSPDRNRCTQDKLAEEWDEL